MNPPMTTAYGRIQYKATPHFVKESNRSQNILSFESQNSAIIEVEKAYFQVFLAVFAQDFEILPGLWHLN